MSLTVKKLKNLLKTLPDDLEIVIDKGESALPGNIWYFTARSIFNCEVKRVLNEKVAQRPCSETRKGKKCVVLY